jgi:hypothetical protein
MSFNAKSEILLAIAKTDDANLKMLLLLMLGVLEEIGGKIDSIWADEKSLRDTVLNGHAPMHHDHHEWIMKKIKEEQEAAEDARKVKVSVLEKTIGYLAVLFIGGILAWLGLQK